MILKWLFNSLILILGLFGNIVGYNVFRKKELVNFPAREFYIVLSFIDTTSFTLPMFQDLLLDLKIDIALINEFSCKFFSFTDYTTAPISAWMIVYISVDRYIAVRFPQNILIKKASFQRLFIFLIIISNALFYSPSIYYIRLVSKDNFSYECKFIDEESKKFMNTMSLVNSTLLPFVFMLIFSILLIHILIKLTPQLSKKNITNIFSSLKFGASTIFLNIFFFIFNFPLCIANLMSTDFTRNFYLHIFYIGCCVNFYVLFVFNGIFYNECLKLFNFKVEAKKNLEIEKINNSLIEENEMRVENEKSKTEEEENEIVETDIF